MALNSCCFCIDLRRGSLISGYLIMLYNAVTLGIRFHTLGSLYLMVEDFDVKDMLGVFGLIVLITIGFITLLFLRLLSAVVMLLGLHKSKPAPILVSLIATGVLLAIDLTVSVCIIITYGAYYDEYTWGTVALDNTFKCLYVYLLFVCGSYRSKLCNQGQTAGNLPNYLPSYLTKSI